MTQYPSTPNLAKAIISLIKAVGPIAKNSEVGTGKNAYKAVSDKDVKEKVGKVLADNGLSLLPIDVVANESTYTSKDYNGNDRLNFFTSVTTKYLLLHESGESIVLTGYGHGVDTQDKAAGKATTYALKYLLLYLSMAATGGLDESEGDDMSPKTVVPPGASTGKPAAMNQKSEPPKQSPPKSSPQQAVASFESQAAAQSAPAAAEKVDTMEKHVLVKDDEKWARVIAWVITNKGKDLAWIIQKLKVNNTISAETEAEIKKVLES